MSSLTFVLYVLASLPFRQILNHDGQSIVVRLALALALAHGQPPIQHGMTNGGVVSPVQSSPRPGIVVVVRMRRVVVSIRTSHQRYTATSQTALTHPYTGRLSIIRCLFQPAAHIRADDWLR